jgi:hypothetical protein
LLIIRALAEGIDPHTGEVFPAGSVYQHADTVRALFAAVEALESVAAEARKRADLPVQAGKSWSDEEDAHLRDGFAARTPAKDLAETHGRTPGAIRARLVKLGLIAERNVYP